MSLVKVLVLKYKVNFDKARLSEILYDIKPVHFIQNAGLSTCGSYSCVAKLLLKNVSQFIKIQKGGAVVEWNWILAI